MVIRVPSVETFVKHAKEAGATRAYTITHTKYRHDGVPTCRARVVLTAVGVIACHAGGPEKVLLRHEYDFGAAVLVGTRVPERYREKVDGYAADAEQALVAAGFAVHAGEITDL